MVDLTGQGLWVWGLFNAFLLAMLALDLGVLQRKAHVIGIRESLALTGLWIAMALAFAAFLWLWGDELGLLATGRGGQELTAGRTALDFLTAWLIEKSLSMDNIFVFILVFRYFAIPPEYQHKVLFWGILGALVFRLSFILAGLALLHRFHWVSYLLGALLVFMAFRLWRQKNPEIAPERNPVLRVLRRFVPVQKELANGKFIVKRDGKRCATPLLVALVTLETTDVLFALDSIPAVLSVTTDEFIAYSSNAFAILGLRALYFALAHVIDRFRDLHYGLSLILGFVGAKLIVGGFMELPDWMPAASLIVVTATLAGSIVTSLLRHPHPSPATSSSDRSPSSPSRESSPRHQNV